MKPSVLSHTDADALHLVEQTCPNCKQVLWSRPNAAFICARCYIECQCHFLLHPTGEEISFDADLITWSDEELAQLDLIPVKVPPIGNPTFNKRYRQAVTEVEA